MDIESLKSSLVRLRGAANSFLSEYEPLMLLLAPLLTVVVARAVGSFLRSVQDNGLKALIVGFVMSSIKLVPGVKSYIDAEKQKVVDKMQSGTKSKREGWLSELPKEGLGPQVLVKLKEEKDKDVDWRGKCSGTVYIGGAESEGHFAVINEACSMFAHTNPLHLDVFPSVARFEAEVVAMTAALLGSQEKASGGEVCGNMTSGGTESILLAMKTSRDYMKAKKGITKPEMIIPVSAHSAYDKAAQYFNIKLCRVPVDKDFKADVKAIRRHINRNTILIVGSAPGFPHGVIDPIEVRDFRFTFTLNKSVFFPSKLKNKLCCRSLDNWLLAMEYVSMLTFALVDLCYPLPVCSGMIILQRTDLSYVHDLSLTIKFRDTHEVTCG
ncbi:Sphingosine-1-phosphate lyase [Linum perenne]